MVRFSDAYPGYNDAPDEEAETIEEHDNTDERRHAVRRALNKLSAKHKKVIVLCEFEGFSQEEAAEILGISVGTVRSRMHYARNNLKRFLKKYVEKKNEM